MTFKQMKQLLPGKMKLFRHRKIFLMDTKDLTPYLSDEDWYKISQWESIAIDSSKDKVHGCFEVRGGWDGEIGPPTHITISIEKLMQEG